MNCFDIESKHSPLHSPGTTNYAKKEIKRRLHNPGLVQHCVELVQISIWLMQVSSMQQASSTPTAFSEKPLERLHLQLGLPCWDVPQPVASSWALRSCRCVCQMQRWQSHVALQLEVLSFRCPLLSILLPWLCGRLTRSLLDPSHQPIHDMAE